MPLSREIRLLQSKWQSGRGWPKRLESIEIDNVRGWVGQRVRLHEFPIVAMIGENGVGKSTILQAAASAYRSPGPKKSFFASDFFPDTAWEQIEAAEIRYTVLEGNASISGSVRKPSTRWRGNPERRQRNVEYIDLSRVQPLGVRPGYSKMTKPQYHETRFREFEQNRLERLSQIMGRQYDLAKMSLSDADDSRWVPIISQNSIPYSGFHQGAGETTITELLGVEIPQHSIVLIDEIETSLHPRSQRRLIRDLASLCRDRELQIILSTHSPYILDELPPHARSYIFESGGERQVVTGVSPYFAMTRMDDEQHPECDIYVEDERAEAMVSEIIVAHDKILIHRCQIIPYGAASVGLALGIMVDQGRFPRPSCVFLDGDQETATGCHLLPGEDAPERVVFEQLEGIGWLEVSARTGRFHSEIVDACQRAMTLADHHEWVPRAADELFLGSNILWQSLCAAWATQCLDEEIAARLAEPINDALNSTT